MMQPDSKSITPPLDRAPTTARSERPLILIVDDEPSIIQSLYSILKDNYEVCMARSGEEAILFCGRRRPDLILMDVVMPGMSGHEACHWLKANESTKEVPIIFVTSNNDPLDEAESLRVGAVDFLSKPVHAKVVLARVHVHLTLREQALRLSTLNERFSLAAQTVGLGVWELDQLTKVAYLDDCTLQLFGLESEGKNCSWQDLLNRIHRDDIDRVLRTHKDSFAQQQPFDIEFRIVRPNGEEHVMRSAAVVGASRVSAGLRMTGVNWDITSLKQAERMKEEFVAMVSHELRTPLTSIRGALGLLLGSKDASRDAIERVANIALRNADRLNLLVDDLLDYEKLDIGHQELLLSLQSVKRVVAQSIEANAGYAIKQGIQFKLSDCATDLYANIDANRIMQVLANLMSNAAKFSPKGASVILTIQPVRVDEAEFIRVSVRDCGPGIPVEFRSSIFQKFKQAQQPASKPKSGTGLGLAISKVIVEKHGGRIGFETETDVGTTFYFDLPRVNAQSTEPV